MVITPVISNGISTSADITNNDLPVVEIQSEIIFGWAKTENKNLDEIILEKQGKIDELSELVSTLKQTSSVKETLPVNNPYALLVRENNDTDTDYASGNINGKSNPNPIENKSNGALVSDLQPASTDGTIKSFENLISDLEIEIETSLLFKKTISRLSV